MIDAQGVQVGIDIGTSKTVVAISQRDELEDKLLVLGIGYARNQGVRKGKIVNLENTITSIKKAAEDTILMAGVDFQTANINIPGEVESMNSKGIAGISRKDREVKSSDVQRVLEQAQILNIGQDKFVLHVFPQHFKLDEQDNIKDPVGMTGLRLEGYVHLVTVPRINLTNVVKCVNRAGYRPREGLATCFASANAVLSDEDKEAGALVIDMGAGTTDVIGFEDGYPLFSSVILLGGNNLTRDLSIGLKVADGMAESIKKRYGCVYEGLVDPVEEIEVPMYGRNQVERISRQRINAILEPRAEEILLLVRKKMEEKGLEVKNFSIAVITGGSSKIAGMAQLTEKVLGIPTRIGIPQKVGGIADEVRDPSFSTAIGLCMGEKYHFRETVSAEKGAILSPTSQGIMKKIGSFFREIFG